MRSYMAVKMNGITDNHTDRMNPTKILNVKKKQSKTKTGYRKTHLGAFGIMFPAIVNFGSNYKKSKRTKNSSIIYHESISTGSYSGKPNSMLFREMCSCLSGQRRQNEIGRSMRCFTVLTAFCQLWGVRECSFFYNLHKYFILFYM